MESYIYKTHKDELGYFQIYNDEYRYFHFNDGIYQDNVGNWPQRNNLFKLMSASPANYVIPEDEFLDNMSYYINLGRTGEPVRVISKTKIIDAGYFFPRINRGEPSLSEHQINTDERADEVRAFSNILQSLDDIFRTIEPEMNNFNAYGNRIRELLIISCTEAEYLLKRAVIENGITSKGVYYNTTDYAWCLTVQKLNEYEVSLPAYPTLGNFKPFFYWDAKKATASLSWYNAYNSVKHDRGTTKSKATLQKLVESIAAIHILLEAQYGKDLFDFRGNHTFPTIFKTIKRPSWKISELSMPLLEPTGMRWIANKKHP